VTAVFLVERAARGDRDAFDLVVTTVIDRLYALARIILRDADLAEDAVQEALINCWRELPKLRDATRFDPWLHRLLVNAATDQHRRRRRFRSVVAVVPEMSTNRDFTADLAIADELKAAFERLRIEHRSVLVLHHYLGLAPAEIAEVLHVPVGTVKSRLHYATQSMRAAIDAGTRSVAAPDARENAG
jgi:RNA polymerase sigma-70 factor (ECF subfamily)